MANQRGTFAKRQREMDLKDKARAKEARRAAKKDEQRSTKGPQIAWDQPGGAIDNGAIDSPATPDAATPPDAPTDSAVDGSTDDATDE